MILNEDLWNKYATNSKNYKGLLQFVKKRFIALAALFRCVFEEMI